MRKKIGIMQGRLLRREIKSRMQSFPIKQWKKEFKYLNKLKLNIMEWTIDYDKFDKNPINTKNGQREILRLKEKYQIKIPSVTADFFMQKPFFKKKFKKFESKIIKLISILILNASYLKIKYIILPLVDRSSIKNRSEEVKLINSLNRFVPLLKQKNMNILFESDFKPKKLLKFIKFFNKSNFGINYDTGNSTNLNYIFENEMIYFNYIKNVHLKDRKVNGESTRFGKGDTNFYKILNFFKKKKYSGNLILQSYLPIYKDPRKEIKYNLKDLNKII